MAMRVNPSRQPFHQQRASASQFLLSAHREIPAIVSGMRALFTALLTTVFFVIQYLDNPELCSSAIRATSGFWKRVVQDKEIRVEGLRWVSRTEVERLLPINRSVFWWMVNAPVVQARIAENPWVGSARVERCGEGIFSDWGCFVVSVNERSPRYLGIVDEEPWVIAADGTFLVPATSAVKEGTEDRYRGLVALEGLASRHQSPDLVRSQVALAAQAINALEGAVNRRVAEVSFEGRGDLGIRFEDLSFPIIFSAATDSTVSLREQGDRCTKLLSQLQGRLKDVDRIDLAFSQVGVVKFKGQT